MTTASLCLRLSVLIITTASLSVDAPPKQTLTAGKNELIMCATRVEQWWEKPQVKFLDPHFEEITPNGTYRVIEPGHFLLEGGLLVRNVQKGKLPPFVVCEVTMPELKYMRHYFIELTVVDPTDE